MLENGTHLTEMLEDIDSKIMKVYEYEFNRADENDRFLSDCSTQITQIKHIVTAALLINATGLRQQYRKFVQFVCF